MPVYKCKIAIGDHNSVERIFHSNSLREVKKQIKKDGHFLLSVEKKEKSIPFLTTFKNNTIKTKDFYSFNQEFLTLLRAGLPVISAFDGIIKNKTDSYFLNVITRIRDDISEGESISNAFEKYTTFFSPLYIATLRSGEVSGDLPGSIEEYLEYFKRSQKLRQKIKAASIYPAILIICSLAVVAFLIIFVVPTITGTFVEVGSELPLFTKILLSIGEFFRSYFLIVLLGFGLLFWGVSYSFKTEKGRLLFDFNYLKIPFLGELSVIYATTLFTSSLSTVLGAGLPLNQAIRISKELINNIFLRTGINNALSSIEKGEGFARALDAMSILPEMAIRMISAGEEGGNLEKVLKDVAMYYENDLEAKLSILTSAIEPILMVLMGFIIGFIMLAMYMPIFQMAGNF